MQAVTAAAVTGISDLIAQKLSSSGSLNWRRAIAMGVILPYVPHAPYTRQSREFECTALLAFALNTFTALR